MNDMRILIVIYIICAIMIVPVINNPIYDVVNIPIFTAFDDRIIEFSIAYKDLNRWLELVHRFEADNNLESGPLKEAVVAELTKYKYSASIISGIPDHSITSILSHEASHHLLRASSLYGYKLRDALHDRIDSKLLFHADKTTFSKSNSYVDIQMLTKSMRLVQRTQSKSYLEQLYSHILPTSSIPKHILAQQKFIVYNTRGVDTGGTIALNMLYLHLKYLGYNVLLCNDVNFDSHECTTPSGEEVVFSGEWCREVLDDFLSSSTSGQKGVFAGRGVQYHLGFHHYSDTCRGHVSVGDSHHIHNLLSTKTLGAYYLGCIMTPTVLNVFIPMLGMYENDFNEIQVLQNGDKKDKNSDISQSYIHNLDAIVDITSSKENLKLIRKENLIIVDADFFHEYAPRDWVQVAIPTGYEVILLKDVPRVKVPMLLLRAKIVLDLAMPGPERISGEGILLGAVPIISSRWNGASNVDFPGVRRVDNLNTTDITLALRHVASNYEDELKKARNGRFFNYIVSMWRRAHHTIDVFAGSASLHFVLLANNLSEEVISVFQVLSLLYVYPLASIDLYVRDVKWFIRHHYLFMAHMKEGGYMRYDEMDPMDDKPSQTEKGYSHEYVRIMHISDFARNMRDMANRIKAKVDMNPNMEFTSTLHDRNKEVKLDQTVKADNAVEIELLNEEDAKEKLNYTNVFLDGISEYCISQSLTSVSDEVTPERFELELQRYNQCMTLNEAKPTEGDISASPVKDNVQLNHTLRNGPTARDGYLCKPWSNVVVVLRNGVTFPSPHTLLDFIANIQFEQQNVDKTKYAVGNMYRLGSSDSQSDIPTFEERLDQDQKQEHEADSCTEKILSGSWKVLSELQLDALVMLDTTVLSRDYLKHLNTILGCVDITNVLTDVDMSSDEHAYTGDVDMYEVHMGRFRDYSTCDGGNDVSDVHSLFAISCPSQDGVKDPSIHASYSHTCDGMAERKHKRGENTHATSYANVLNGIVHTPIWHVLHRFYKETCFGSDSTISIDEGEGAYKWCC